MVYGRQLVLTQHVDHIIIILIFVYDCIIHRVLHQVIFLIMDTRIITLVQMDVVVIQYILWLLTITEVVMHEE